MTLAGDFAGAALVPGFADPVPAAQRVFRTVLDALAHPGRIKEMPFCLEAPPPAPLGAAAAAVALTLCDIDTPLWLDAPLRSAASYLAFHCGSPSAPTPAEAAFALVTDPTRLPPLDAFALGNDEYPDRSATLVVEVASLTGGPAVRLAGPGVDGMTQLAVGGMRDGFWDERMALAALFPRGLDILFTSGAALAALPRSTRISR